MNQFILRVYNPKTKKFTGDVPGYYDLDVDQDSAEVKATLSTVENQNLGRVFGLGTQDFTLPGTKKNNEFFDYTDNPGVAAAPFVFKKVYDAEILVNGARVSKGKLYYNGNNTNAAGALFYNVNYTDTIPSLADIFGELRMGDLPWLSAGYDHAFTWTNIEDSWTNAGSFPLNGAVKYPNAFYGYEDGENYRYDLSGNGTSVFNQGSQGGRLLTSNWKPAVRLTNIMDLIFTGSILNQDGESNYENNLSISSSFLDGNFQFGDADTNNTSGDLYILPSGDGKKGPTDPVPQYVLGVPSSSFGPSYTLTSNNDVVFYVADETFVADGVTYYPNMEVTQDTNDQWGVSGAPNAFTCKVAGNHTFNLVVSTINLPLTYHDVKVQYIKNRGPGQEVFEVQTSKNAGIGNFTFDDISTTIELAVDDTVEIFFRLVDAGGGGLTVLAKCALEIINNNPQPDVVFMDYQWGDLKVIDFIKGLQQMFNLVFWTDYDEPNVIKIEPYNEWLDQGTERDWSDRVDHSSGISVTHPSQEQAKEVVFDYAEGDGNDHEYVRRVNDGKQRGYYKYISDSDYQIGRTEEFINPVFTPTTMNPLDGAVGNAAIRNMTIPIIRQIDGGVDRPYAFKPRILFNNGVKEVENGQGNDRLYTIFDPIANQEYTTNEYLQMSPLTSMEYIDNAGIGVQFASLEFMPAASYWWNSDRITEYQHQATQDGLFNLFYARQYNNLYRNEARKVTMNLMFEPQDITEFRLNDLIFIDGQKYRINKISGFDFIRESSCEVELIKELQPFNSPVFSIGNNGGTGNPGNPGPIDPSEPIGVGDEFVFEGVFTGTNFNVDPVYIKGEKSGSIVSASLVQEYQPKQLGITPSSGSKFFSKLFSPAPNISDPVVGGDLDQNGNTIPNEASTTTVALGDNNVFNQGTSKNAIVGDANSVGANTTDTQIVGDNNILAANTEKTSVVGANNEFTASLKNALVVATGSSIPSDYDNYPFESLTVLGQRGELPTTYANQQIRSYYYTDSSTIEGDTQVFIGSASVDPNLSVSSISGTGPLAGINGEVLTQPGGALIAGPTFIHTPKLLQSNTGADVFEGGSVTYRPPFPSMVIINSAGSTSPTAGTLAFDTVAANTVGCPNGLTLELISLNNNTDQFNITFESAFYFLGTLRSPGSVVLTTAGSFKYIKWVSIGNIFHEIIRTNH